MAWAEQQKKGMIVLETRHRRKDGTIFPIEVIANYIVSDGEEYSFVFTQDITERKQTEMRIERLSRLYQSLSEVNQAIVRMEQQAELFPLVCRCAVEFGGMKLAWIGQLDEVSGMIVPVASDGDWQDYLDSIRVSSRADVPEGRSTTGTALRENRAIIINDFLNNPMTAPWRAQAENLGWASAAAFPIQRGGRPFAVLTVCHAQVNAFDEEAIALLEEMSTDISFALDNFDRETQRKAGEESLRLAASVYAASNEGILITDAENRIMAINPAFTQITGYDVEEVIGKNPGIFKSGRHDEAFYQAMWNDINTTGHWQGEIWDRRKNGEVYPQWLTINTIFNEDGTVQRRVAMFTDVTQKRETEQLIWRQANFDFLTELPNRQMFYDRLDQDIKKAHRAGRPLALMFLDLDRFKEVNDTLGHDMGDAMLKDAAQRLSSCVRETDTVARLGGDEFTVILSELDDPSSVDRVAREILRKLTEPFQLGEEVVYVSASIGITLYPDDATAIETLLKNADQAMYAAKNLGRNRYSYFTPSMQQAVQTRMQIANDLRGALAGHQFWIAYQPIVELATGAIHKAEALLRWQHPTQGLINPAAFIPVAEDTGLIIDIGDWVFREAAQQAQHWRASLHPAFQISVNKSPVQFHNESQTHLAWYDYLRQLGLSGQSITVEITEGLLLDASTLVTDQLLEFRDAGIQVAIDDFGTGYSALSYLKKFDIDFLKIDQSFTRNLASGSDDMALCEAIIVMAHKLDMQVIAEGVETEEQKNLLATAGCDYAQGFLFSKPVPAEEFEKLL
jgi:diguanylate cyclase (GGDEF)-like protein/PAS domain S-box-containing protein